MPTNLGYILELNYADICLSDYLERSTSSRWRCRNPGLDFEIFRAFCIWTRRNCSLTQGRSMGTMQHANTSNGSSTLFQLLLHNSINAIVNSIPYDERICNSKNVSCTAALYAMKIDIITRRMSNNPLRETVLAFQPKTLLALLLLAAILALVYTIFSGHLFPGSFQILIHQYFLCIGVYLRQSFTPQQSTCKTAVALLSVFHHLGKMVHIFCQSCPFRKKC